MECNLIKGKKEKGVRKKRRNWRRKHKKKKKKNLAKRGKSRVFWNDFLKGRCLLTYFHNYNASHAYYLLFQSINSHNHYIFPFFSCFHKIKNKNHHHHCHSHCYIISPSMFYIFHIFKFIKITNCFFTCKLRIISYYCNYLLFLFIITTLEDRSVKRKILTHSTLS